MWRGGNYMLKHLDSFLVLGFYLLVLLVAIVQFAVGKCGLVSFVLTLIFVLPLIARRSFALYQQIAAERNNRSARPESEKQ